MACPNLLLLGDGYDSSQSGAHVQGYARLSLCTRLYGLRATAVLSAMIMACCSPCMCEPWRHVCYCTCQKYSKMLADPLVMPSLACHVQQVDSASLVVGQQGGLVALDARGSTVVCCGYGLRAASTPVAEPFVKVCVWGNSINLQHSGIDRTATAYDSLCNRKQPGRQLLAPTCPPSPSLCCPMACPEQPPH
jgi:hypothetical protein